MLHRMGIHLFLPEVLDTLHQQQSTADDANHAGDSCHNGHSTG